MKLLDFHLLETGGTVIQHSSNGLFHTAVGLKYILLSTMRSGADKSQKRPSCSLLAESTKSGT